ncbi:hypothetical protein BJ508DRAFT_414006 [Ascobolus immersus RN42]|uniref:EF-hand domain-containing protein n=1 Tax=Ascobolus immersus RN42 TaxID=1160509 RepID=A0A3N4I924_ASCIM|nr:hypothetical protein BJ508DRAFT_414006 [Ascobolus immersus RN42]
MYRSLSRSVRSLPSVRTRTLQPAQVRSLHSQTPHRRHPFFTSNPTTASRSQSPSLTSQVTKRVVSTEALFKSKKPQYRLFRFVYRGLAFFGFSVLTITGATLAFFIYDATTYKESAEFGDLSIPEVALSPVRGGPKNLPIAEILVDEEDSEATRKCADKPKLVVLGTGWGSVGLLKNLKEEDWNVTVISTSNYFLYTPLLPSATVGTVELRSLMEPIRRVLQRLKGHFIRASAESVDLENKLVEVSQVMDDGEKRSFYVPYDKLVIGVGATGNTHGVPGLEYTLALKSSGDARRIRQKLIDNFERACLPTTTDDERKKLLSFVVCGGGPTGVEFAAELSDMINEDMITQYPKILRNEISIHLIQSAGHILNTYDEALSTYAESKFARDSIGVLTNSRVQEVRPDRIIFSQKDTEDRTKVITKELPFGLCLWSTGVGQVPFCEALAKSLPGQKNRRALETDSHLRLIGDDSGDVYAIGDCSTVKNNIAEHLTEFITDRVLSQRERRTGSRKAVDTDSIQLSFGEWRALAKEIKKRFPQTSQHLRRLDKLFQDFDTDKSGTLSIQELKVLLDKIDSKLTSLPATAQRANQQGIYLAHKLNAIARSPHFPSAGAPITTQPSFLGKPQLLHKPTVFPEDESVYKAFNYRHLGSLAYVGNAAVFDLGGGWNIGGGLVAMYLWRSVYFAQSVSFRTRMMLAMDWGRRSLFGRDLIMP